MPEFNFSEAKLFVTESIGTEAVDDATVTRYLEEYSTLKLNIRKYRPFIVLAQFLYLTPSNNIKGGDGITLEGNNETALRLLNEQYRLDMLYGYDILDLNPISAKWAIKQLLAIKLDYSVAQSGTAPIPPSIVTGILF